MHWQKEQLDGKTNLVLLHLKGNPKAEIEDSISYVKEILDEKKTELLEHALMDYGSNDLPKPCKLASPLIMPESLSDVLQLLQSIRLGYRTISRHQKRDLHSSGVSSP